MKEIIKNILGLLLSTFIAFLIVFLLKTFVGMPTTVKGTSMVPTFYEGQKLFLSTWSSTFDKVPNRGDIITFEAPTVDLIENANLANPVAIYDENSKSLFEKAIYYGLGITGNSYIKRVIGLPGEHIQIKNGRVYVNGVELKETYIRRTIVTDMSLGGEFYDLIVPEGYVFVLGDNRESSADSRRFGCIPVDKIEGKVVYRWWPLNKLKIVK